MVPQGYFDYARSRESSGNLFAKNPRSSASGLFQFTDGTWADVMRKHPELGLTPDGRFNEDQQNAAMRAFTDDNAAHLTSAGYPVNRDSLYLAHRFGAGGAVRALSADPNALVSDIFPEVMRANPDLQGKRIADITGRSSMADYGTEISPAQRRPLPGALSPSNVFGSGALSNDADLGSGLERAGVYLMGISNPAALGALGSIGPKAGRYNASYDKDTGLYTIVDGQTGRVIQQRNPNFDPMHEQKKAYDTASAKEFVDLNTKVYNDAQTANSQIASLQQLKSLLADPNVYQGAGGEKVADLKKLGNALGITKFEGTSNADVARSIANQLTLSLRNFSGGMPGSLSDKDLAFLRQMSVSLDNTPQANQEVLDHILRAYQRASDVNGIREKYVREKGRLDEGFRQRVSDFARTNPLYDGVAMPSATPVAPSATPALPKGVKSIKIIQ